MSQKPFIWNNNNAVGFADPSGYDAIFQGNDGAGDQPLFTDYYVGDPGSLVATPNSVLQAQSQAQDKLDALNAQPDPTNRTYHGPEAAAKAASAKFDESGASLGLEIGCEIYCTGKNACGYTPGTLGTADFVYIPVSAFPSGTTAEGIWHSHPDTSSLSSLDDHQSQMTSRYLQYQSHGVSTAIPMRTYTTLQDGSWHEQDWYGISSQ